MNLQLCWFGKDLTILTIMTKLWSQICDHNFVITLDYDCFIKQTQMAHLLAVVSNGKLKGSNKYVN